MTISELLLEASDEEKIEVFTKAAKMANTDQKRMLEEAEAREDLDI